MLPEMADERREELHETLDEPTQETLNRALELWRREDMVSVAEVSAANFRAFRELRLKPGRITALVGPNAAGKSSIIDLFRFVSDAVNLSLYTAFERRGGLRAVRHTAPGGRPRNVGVEIKLDFGDGFSGSYQFRTDAKAGKTYAVGQEACQSSYNGAVIDELVVKKGRVTASGNAAIFRPTPVPEVDEMTLALPLYGGAPGLSPVLSALRDLRAYSIVPDRLRELQDPDEGTRLLFDGRNAASVLRHLHPDDRAELIEMLAHVVPGIVGVRSVQRGNKLTLEFTQHTERGDNRFEALQMSDGTLRLLGLLLAMYQRDTPRFMAIEEPEATIHVAALQALMEVFKARSDDTQILLTTHSAEILDSVDIDDVYLVEAEDGYSRIGAVAEGSLAAVGQALFSPGELLRSGELRATR